MNSVLLLSEIEIVYSAERYYCSPLQESLYKFIWFYEDSDGAFRVALVICADLSNYNCLHSALSTNLSYILVNDVVI